MGYELIIHITERMDTMKWLGVQPPLPKVPGLNPGKGNLGRVTWHTASVTKLKISGSTSSGGLTSPLISHEQRGFLLLREGLL